MIDNGDATAQQIANQKTNVDNALAALNQAKANLTADTSTLQQAVQQLDRTGDTTGKKPASIKAYNQAMQALNHDLTSARDNANAIINKPIRTVQEVQDALRNVNQVNDRITQAIAQLQPLADNSELKTAKAKLEAEINKTVSTDGMTQATINAYQNAKQAAQVEVNTAQQVINNGDASDQDIATEKSKVEEKYNALKQAIANLTPDLAPLQSAKTELENDINQPTSTTGMTSQSVANFNNKLNAAKQKLQAIKQVLQSNPSVATIRDNVTQANNAKTALDTARNGLTVDKAPLEAAKTQLQQSITQAEQTSTTGMTQSTASTFNDKLAAAKEKMKTITQVLKGSPTVDQINTNTSAANNAKTELDQARTNLTPDKAPLQQAKADLQVAINQAQSTDTTGMTQDSVTEFNNKLNAAKEKMKDIDRVLSSQATVAQLTESKNQATTAKNELDQARTNLTPDKAPLETAKSQLQQSINQAQNTNTTGMTQASKDALTAKLNAAKEKMTAINNVLNGSPTVADINTNVTEATNSKNALDQAIQSLVVDKAPLQNAKSALEQSISQAQQTSTAGMTQATVSTFNDKLAAARQKLQDIEQVLAGNPTVNDINSNTTATNNVKDALNQARQNLTVDKAPLETAKASLQQSINQAQQASTTGMTQASINALNNKLSAAKAKIKAIDNVLKGQPTVNDITNNTNETNTVKSELDQALQALTPDKTPLQNAKTELEQSVNQPTDTVGMTTASLNAYNQKLEAARQTLNGVNQELAGNPTVQTINDKVTQANNAKSALDQARAALELDRAPMLSALQNATSLNNTQRNAFTNQINTAPNHAALVSIQNNINELNTAMTNLRNSVADNSTIKKQIKYTDATSSNRTNYNNAVNNANQIIAEKNNPTMTASTINQKAAAVNTTKDALDGEQNLQRAKAEATAAITNASDLNQSQKNALTQQVTQAQNVQAAKVIKQNAESLNTAMTGLKQSIANHDQLIQSDNYVNADTDKKNAYTNAYNSAKAIVDGTGQNPTLTPNEVTQASQTVTQTVQDLNGTTNLNNAKQQAQTTLGQLSHLNQAQRQALETQINDAHQIATVNDVKQNATNIDNAMANLQQAIANKDEVKRSEDYVDADTNKQSAYNQAVTNAENINKQTANPTMNISDINQATTQVTTTKDALNGDEKLEKAKQRAVTTLNTLTHLNNAQKADITSNINKAPNIATVNKVSQTANDLDTAMERLQVGINDENTTLTSQNYQDATPDKKVNYTSAIQNAKAILNPNGPNKNKAQVEKALGQVKTAKDALDGQRLLEQAKQNAIQQLQQLTHLTNAQKDALTTQINGGATISDVQATEATAGNLDNAMDALKQSIADQATVRNNEDYHDASPDNQNAYNNAIHAAEGIINAANNPELNADTITAKAQQVIQAKSDLNGDENLATAKQNAQAYLNTLPRLTDQQKDAINTNITKARNIDAVNQIKQAAQSLNSAMNDLQNAVNNQPQVTSTVDYTDADTNKQQAYNDAITAAQAILNKTTGPNTAQNKVEEALQRITTAQNNLNGNAKLTAAKTAANQQLGTLAHITDAQRHSLENDITQATNLAGVEQVNQKAQSLDNAMSQLETLVNNSNTIQNEQNYLDADQSKQSDYDLNIVTAQSTVDKTNGPNTPESEVNSLISQIQQAQQALNGQQNLEKAKQSATTTIDQSTDLNNAQKSALKTQVTNGKRVAEVNAINQLATELNNAMTNLKQSIVDKEQTLNSINYINADEDKRQTYTTQVNNAESIINGTQNGVLIPSEITK